MTQEAFYPINSPLINYFFYKAPFITNAYSLTNISVQNGGSGYEVNDVIVMADGVYTSPAVVQVSQIGEGNSVTQVIITNNGRYTVTPTDFTQASTNGSGLGATFFKLNFAANILPNGVNVPLAGGFLFFYADEDHTLQLPTYSDVSDPQNPVVNTNPIQLGASGECPLFYLQDRLYYIVITDYTGDQANPVQTISHYNPADQSVTSAFNNNFVVNPQFNYPIVFWKTTDDEGEVDDPSTFVAWGCEFLQDENTNTENIITFNPVSGLEIEGHPINELILNSDDVSSTETLKDFRWTIGAVDINAESSITFCAQMMSKTSSNIPTILFFERFYGEGGSDTEVIPVNTFTVTSTRQKFVFSFILPTIVGKVIGDGNYLAIRLQPGLRTVCTFGMTNVMVLPGMVANPVFVDEAQGFSKGQILGVSTDISNAGLYQNFSSYYYTDGDIFPLADTGTIVLETNGTQQQFRELCDGTSRLVNSYSTHNIPYKRLYDVIGNTYGSAGTLVASSNADIVTVHSSVGAVEHSTWTAGTTSFTVTKVLQGLQYDLNATITGTNVITVTFFTQYAPSQTGATILGANGAFYTPPTGLFGYWKVNYPEVNQNDIVVATVAPGSPSTHAVATLTFNSFDIVTKPYTTIHIPYSAGFLDYAANPGAPSDRGGVDSFNVFHPTGTIYFSLNGFVQGSFIAPQNPGYNPIVPFLTSNTALQNMKSFVNTVANPFVFTITVNAFPSAGQYILYSDATTDFYGWFTVDGVGTDPAVPSRTGVVFPIFTGNTTTQIAEIIANALNDFEFSLPATSDLPALVGSSKVSWYINL